MPRDLPARPNRHPGLAPGSPNATVKQPSDYVRFDTHYRSLRRKAPQTGRNLAPSNVRHEIPASAAMTKSADSDVRHEIPASAGMTNDATIVIPGLPRDLATR
ncbi:protein of unknown function [Micropruina glycogenica]|uniref:Uncharacterized protein n=1 Tax=Micropruina glycogenica TaxID=75385 RepID=A0A2N9JKY9_9ACTN|nr:protein of unknown function [Micropruina glycogenica]